MFFSEHGAKRGNTPSGLSPEGLCTKRRNAEAWFDGLTTNGAINQPFALSLSKGNLHDRATSRAKPP